MKNLRRFNEDENTSAEPTKTFTLVFEVNGSSGDYEMSRAFDTESVNTAKTEAQDMENELSGDGIKFTLSRILDDKGMKLSY